MVPNLLSTNDKDKKPAKLEAETLHETVEVHYMMPNIGSNVGSKTNSNQCDSFNKSLSLTKVRCVYSYNNNWCHCIASIIVRIWLVGYYFHCVTFC